MPKIIKNGKEYSGVPIEVVTAWAPTADPVQVKEPLMGNTDISNIGDGTVTGAIDTIKSGLTELKTATIISSSQMTHVSTTAFEGTIVVRAGVMLGFLIFSPTNDIDPSTGDIVTGGIPEVIAPVQLPLVCVAGADSGKAGRVLWSNNKIKAWYSNVQPKAGSTYLIPIHGVGL